MPFVNPLNYLLAVEDPKPKKRDKDGASYSTALNPLFLSYNIVCRGEYVEIEKVTEAKLQGSLVFDIHNKSPYPLFNYSTQIDHYLNGVHVKNFKFDAPYLAPEGGNDLRQSFETKWVELARATMLVYQMKGYVKGVGYNQRVNSTRSVKVRK